MKESYFHFLLHHLFYVAELPQKVRTDREALRDNFLFSFVFLFPFMSRLVVCETALTEQDVSVTFHNDSVPRRGKGENYCDVVCLPVFTVRAAN